jgi:fatty acid desaturase
MTSIPDQNILGELIDNETLKELPISGELIDSETLKELRKLDFFKICLQSLFNLSLYAFLGAVGIWWNIWWVWLIVWWFQGCILGGCLNACHDCTHASFGKSLLVNRLAGIFWSSIILLNFTLYKYFHFEHHRYANAQGDPESPRVFSNLWDYVQNLPGTSFSIPFWLMSVRAAFGHFPHFIRSEKARRDVHLDNIALLVWLLMIVTATVLWPDYTIRLYWIPLIVFLPMEFWLNSLDHYGCDQGANVLCNTRSTSSNFLLRYILWNSNYHAEHHAYPSIPSHNLHRLHLLIGDHFKFREQSYVLFHLKLIWSLLKCHLNSK